MEEKQVAVFALGLPEQHIPTAAATASSFPPEFVLWRKKKNEFISEEE